jgi:DNA-binding GntR family transcriptional regulator
MGRASATSYAIAEQLRADIIRGVREPGSPLRQELVASELGVSRMPVRDALNQLQSEGLVELIPNRGAFVASMTAEECAEVFELRAILECSALSYAIAQHTDKSIRRLQQIQQELELEDDPAAWAQGDRQFHEALYEPCQRQRTLRIIEVLRNVVERFYLAKLSHDAHRVGWKREHRAILKAVAARDTDEACHQLCAHLCETQKVVTRVIQQRR